MLANFKNGVFALGVLVGILSCIGLWLGVPGIATLQDGQGNHDLALALVGAIVGGGIGVLTAFGLNHVQVTNKAIDLSTAVQIKLFQNENIIKGLVSRYFAAKGNSQNVGISGEISCLFNLIVPSGTASVHDPSPEELALMMRILPSLSERSELLSLFNKQRDIRSNFLFLTERVEEILESVGYRRHVRLAGGQVTVDAEVITKANESLLRLQTHFEKLVEEETAAQTKLLDFLLLLQERMQKYTGHAPNFLEFERVN